MRLSLKRSIDNDMNFLDSLTSSKGCTSTEESSLKRSRDGMNVRRGSLDSLTPSEGYTSTEDSRPSSTASGKRVRFSVESPIICVYEAEPFKGDPFQGCLLAIKRLGQVLGLRDTLFDNFMKPYIKCMAIASKCRHKYHYNKVDAKKTELAKLLARFREQEMKGIWALLKTLVKREGIRLRPKKETSTAYIACIKENLAAMIASDTLSEVARQLTILETRIYDDFSSYRRLKSRSQTDIYEREKFMGLAALREHESDYLRYVLEEVAETLKKNYLEKHQLL